MRQAHKIECGRASQRGLTLIELIVAFTIMLVLTTMSVPLARAKVRAQRERELRHDFEEVRRPSTSIRIIAISATWAPPRPVPIAGRKNSTS